MLQKAPRACSSACSVHLVEVALHPEVLFLLRGRSLPLHIQLRPQAVPVVPVLLLTRSLRHRKAKALSHTKAVEHTKQRPLATKEVEHTGKRHCLGHKGRGNTRQRRCVLATVEMYKAKALSWPRRHWPRRQWGNIQGKGAVSWPRRPWEHTGQRRCVLATKAAGIYKANALCLGHEGRGNTQSKGTVLPAGPPRT